MVEAGAKHALDTDPYPLAPRLTPLKSILAKLEPPAPKPEPLPPPRPGMAPSVWRRARKATTGMKSGWRLAAKDWTPALKYEPTALDIASRGIRAPNKRISVRSHPCGKLVWGHRSPDDDRRRDYPGSDQYRLLDGHSD